MENNANNSSQFDGASLKEKAKKTWDTLVAENVEITLTTSALGLLLFALGIGITLGISRCITKAEMRSALRKQKKMLLPDPEKK